MQPLGHHRRPKTNNWGQQAWTVAISPNSRTVTAGLRDGSIRLVAADIIPSLAALHLSWKCRTARSARVSGEGLAVRPP